MWMSRYRLKREISRIRDADLPLYHSSRWIWTINPTLINRHPSIKYGATATNRNLIHYKWPTANWLFGHFCSGFCGIYTTKVDCLSIERVDGYITFQLVHQRLSTMSVDIPKDRGQPPTTGSAATCTEGDRLSTAVRRAPPLPARGQRRGKRGGKRMRRGTNIRWQSADPTVALGSSKSPPWRTWRTWTGGPPGAKRSCAGAKQPVQGVYGIRWAMCGSLPPTQQMINRRWLTTNYIDRYQVFKYLYNSRKLIFITIVHGTSHCHATSHVSNILW